MVVPDIPRRLDSAFVSPPWPPPISTHAPQPMSGDRPLENLARQEQHQQHQQYHQFPQIDPAIQFASPQGHGGLPPLRLVEPAAGGGGGGGGGGAGGAEGDVKAGSVLESSQPPADTDALVLLPEVAQSGKPAGSRRPFRRRRRSRACDACRARKTKVGMDIRWDRMGCMLTGDEG